MPTLPPHPFRSEPRAFLPCTSEAHDYTEADPAAPVRDALDVDAANEWLPVVSAAHARQAAREATATVRYVLREEPAGEADRAGWLRTLRAWADARAALRRLAKARQAEADAIAADRAAAAGSVPSWREAA